MMYCEHCDRCGPHLCLELIRKHRESFTPEQNSARNAEMYESLQRAIAAGKELKDKYGIELVCNQKKLDYLESTDMADAVERLVE